MKNDNGEGEIIALLVILCIIGGCVLCGYSVFYDWGLNTGVGQQTGYISEVMNDGWLWQPTQITLLSVVPTYSEKDTSWDYSPANDQITELAKIAMDKHSKVTVHYTTQMSVPRWQYSSRVIITNITMIPE
jgi:hypothetical protein